MDRSIGYCVECGEWIEIEWEKLVKHYVGDEICEGVWPCEWMDSPECYDGYQEFSEMKGDYD